MNNSTFSRNGKYDTNVISRSGNNGKTIDVFAFYGSGKNGWCRKRQSFQLPCVTCALQNELETVFNPRAD